MKPEDSVLGLKGVGKTRGEALRKLGISSIGDLISFYPRDYRDRSLRREIRDLAFDEINTVEVTVCSQAEVSKINNMVLIKLRFKDKSGEVDAIWFNQLYLKNYFIIGREFMLSGKAVMRLGKKTLISPEYEQITGKELLSSARIVPVYTISNIFSQKVYRGIVYAALNAIDSGLNDYLPERIRKEFGLADKEFSIRNIHFPKDADSFFMARKRLVFDEIFLMRLALYRLKGDIKRASGIKIADFGFEELLALIPFQLTSAQMKTVDEIIRDLCGGAVMSRLVQGDVGSGKTVVAMIAAYIVIKNGYQAAIMVPTEVLANQHYLSITKIFSGLGIATELLTGSLKKKERTIIYDKVQSGETKLLIGTHAVIQAGVMFNNLGLVITDEQHRFGVRQRARLSEKGNNPHMLAMSATPIPRTLALILYGDMDISIIDSMPPGRRAIETYAVTSAYRPRYISFLRKQIEEGRQIYVICATIGDDADDENKQSEPDDIMDFENVLEYTEKLKKDLSEYRVGFLHGKMKKEEKNIIMDDFAKGETDVLVSTTVIEVGINVPNASVIVIENADRFGLAQLHQLRGRVGRGEYQSYCILVSDSKSETCRERMKIMKKSNDGFEISEKDLSLRGQGDFFGTRQHGLPDMRIANLFKDMDVLEIASRAADSIIESGSGLDEPEYKYLIAETDIILKAGMNL